MHLIIYLFLRPRYSIFEGWNIKKRIGPIICLERSRCALGNCERVCYRQAALNRWTSTDKRWKRKAVSRGSVFTSVTRLTIYVRNSWALAFIMGPKSFQSYWKKVLGPAERAVFVCLPNSCSLGRTGPDDGTLLEVGTGQGVNHCKVPCGTASCV